MYYKTFLKLPVLCGIVHIIVGGVLAAQSFGAGTPSCAARARALKDTKATYSRPPLLDNGRVDTQLLLKQLVDLHANTYSFLIWRRTNDWDDLDRKSTRL